MSDERRAARKTEQVALVAACRRAMPDPLDPLWDTIAHAPDVAFPDVARALAAAFPVDDLRLRAILTWHGHGDGSCPVCWMLVGRLAFTVPRTIERLGRLLDAQPAPEVLSGAGLFLSAQLEPRHASPAGISREALEAIRLEARELPEPAKRVLLTHWAQLGRDLAELERRLRP